MIITVFPEDKIEPNSHKTASEKNRTSLLKKKKTLLDYYHETYLWKTSQVYSRQMQQNGDIQL